MAERESVRWITIKGKHLPVYADGTIGVGQEDEPVETYKDTFDEALDKKKHVGLGAEWLDFAGSYGEDWNPDVNEKERMREYIKIMQKEGIVPKNAEIDKVQDYLIHFGEYGISEWHEKTPYGLKTEMFARYAEGATKYGYGNDKRQFDIKYKMSDFIDNTKSMHLITDKSMYRGVRTSQKEVDMLKDMYKQNVPIKMDGLSSWTANEFMADKFTRGTLSASGNIPLIYQDVTKGEHNAIPYPFSGQHEAIYSKNNKFKILSMSQDKYGRWLIKVQSDSR